MKAAKNILFFICCIVVLSAVSCRDSSGGQVHRAYLEADQIRQIIVQPSLSMGYSELVIIGQDKIERVAKYLNSLSLTPETEADLGLYDGLSYMILIDRADNAVESILLQGNQFYQYNGGPWMRMNTGQAAYFETLLQEVSQ